MGGDSKTRKFHEQGRNHREALKAFLINTRKRKVAERRADEDKESILKQINADAHRAMGTAGAGANVHAADASCADSNRGDKERRDVELSLTGDAEEGVGDGIYDVDGAFFLMGEHESARQLLIEGAAVEVLISGREEWAAAQVLAVRAVAVPFTTIVTRTVTVALPDGARVDLPAASLRIPLGDDSSAAALRGAAGDARPEDDGGKDVESPPPTVPVDEGTGLGQWATVIVEPSRKRGRVDDATVARTATSIDTGADGNDLAHFHANPSKALDAAASSERRTNAALEAVDDDNRGDAFFTYNPYGGDMYKGIRLGAVVDPAATQAADASIRPAEKSETEGDMSGWATVSAEPVVPVARTAVTTVSAALAAPIVEFKARIMGGGGRPMRKRLE